MEDLKLYLLLKAVKMQKNLNGLKRIGMNFKQISEFAEFAANEKLLIISENEIALTKLGMERLDILREIHKKINKDDWIEKQTDAQIPKFAVDFIYLPEPNELSLD